MKSGKTLLGILAGTAVGAMLALLFSPEKGKEMRRKITAKGEDYADVVKDKFGYLIGDITDKYEKAKEGINDFASTGKAKVKQEIKNIKHKRR